MVGFREEHCSSLSTLGVLHVDQRKNVGLELSVLLLLGLGGFRKSTSAIAKQQRAGLTLTLLVLLNVEATEQHNSLGSEDAAVDLVWRVDARTVHLSVS